MDDEAGRSIFDIVGEDGIRRLVAGFYRRVPDDDLLGPMYPAEELAAAEQRLRDFLVYRFGGPPRYLEERGHTRLRMRHAPFPIGRAARDRWVRHMSAALDDCAFAPPVADSIRAFLADVATFLVNRSG